MKRLLQIDLLKALAITSVVVTHSLTADQLRTASVFTIEQAVPVFFLVMAFSAKQSFDRTSSAASLGEIYRSGYLPRRFKRLLGPLFVAVVLSVALGVLRGAPLYFGPRTLLLYWPVPLRGQFFITITILFVAFAPVLYAAYRRAPEFTVLGCVAADVAFEAVASHVPVFAHTYYLYQIVPLRFAALFALGMWLTDDAHPWSRRNWFIYPSAVASIVFLLVYGLGFRTAFVGIEHMYNVLAFGYPLLLVAAGLTWLHAQSGSPVLNALGEIGKASWHIFLVQGVWLGSAISILPAGRVQWVCVNVVICCGVGYAWYRLGEELRERRLLRGSK